MGSTDPGRSKGSRISTARRDWPKNKLRTPLFVPTPRLAVFARVRSPSVLANDRPLTGGNGESLVRLVPIGGGAGFDDEGDGQGDGGFRRALHHPADGGHGRLGFVLAGLEHQFVVHLQ